MVTLFAGAFAMDGHGQHGNKPLERLRQAEEPPQRLMFECEKADKHGKRTLIIDSKDRTLVNENSGKKYNIMQATYSREGKTVAIVFNDVNPPDDDILSFEMERDAERFDDTLEAIKNPQHVHDPQLSLEANQHFF